MPLQAGVHFGPCEIESRIGAGGMGEVHRARDPRLNRFVALRIDEVSRVVRIFERPDGS